jgi:hypothetical protein
MKPLIQKKLFFSFMSFLLIFSCSEDDFLHYNLSNPQIKLCLSGFVCPDSTYIVLSLNSASTPDTLPAGENRHLISGNNASVILYENDLFFDTLKPKSRLVKTRSMQDYIESYYISLKNASEGKKYTIRAEHKDYNSISAESVLPVVVPILSVDTVVKNYEYSTITSMFLNFQDPGNTNNFYMVTQPEIFRDKYDSLQYNSAFFLYNPIYENENKDAGNYISDNSSWPFFSDRLIQGENFSIEYSYHSNYGDKQPDSIRFTLYSINEDYYKYNSSLYKKEISQYDANSDPVMIYSNVKNGYGILVGYTKSTYTIQIKK